MWVAEFDSIGRVYDSHATLSLHRFEHLKEIPLSATLTNGNLEDLFQTQAYLNPNDVKNHKRRK